MSNIKVGDKVKLRCGRGHTTGTVVNITEATATAKPGTKVAEIRGDSAKQPIYHRTVDSLEKVE